MLNINLVPQRLKDKFKLERISKSISVILFISGAYFILLLGVFYFADYYLKNHLSETTNLAKSANKSTESYTNEINEINNMTKQLIDIQEDHVLWSKFLYHIGLSDNRDVYIKYIQIDKDNDSVNLNIHANTREGLLDFKNAIEKSEYLSEINFPIKTLFEKENIEFSISAKIDSYEFIKL